ncbi:hypothetical protein I4F81_005133 [Pyropia yezoensis]|uniref:Uncharacterized protein n=1 Tax=Pyropia yezoensis TaxID=2788 RepID=A0ACC3BXU9_PYRYE|nr:hypothetical protein I4F81_005133 [Neopyropia yezoensis]
MDGRGVPPPSPPTESLWSWLLPPVAASAALTATAVLLLARSPPLQRALLFGHVARFPRWLVDHTALGAAGLATSARNVTCVTPAGAVLRGWHLAPPGPPFPPPPPHLAAERPHALHGSGQGGGGDGGCCADDPLASATWTAAVDAHFDARLAADTHTPVFVFFHGNGGTRGTPPGRVHFLRTLAAHAHAHVVAFDLGGYADSTAAPAAAAPSAPPPPPPPPLTTGARCWWTARGAVAAAAARAAGYLFPVGPTPASVAADAVAVVDTWLAPRVGGAAGVRARVIPYGHSLGSVAALAAAAGVAAVNGTVGWGGGDPAASPQRQRQRRRRVAGVVLSAPIANLPDAAATHFLSAPLRALPGVWGALAPVVAAATDGRMDNEAAVAAVAADLPLLVVHGRADRVVPASHGRRVAAAAVAARSGRGRRGGWDTAADADAVPAAPVRLVLTDAPHNANYAAGNYFPELTAWLDDVMAPAREAGGRRRRG